MACDCGETPLIKHTIAEKPSTFETMVQNPGEEYLAKNLSARRLPDFWKHCRNELAIAFNHLCAYSAMHTQFGTVDHFFSTSKFPHLAYDWNNYRYADGSMNSRKGNVDQMILDPFEVEDNWFEIQIPSLQLLPTGKIPPEYIERARFTLERLRLKDDEHIIQIRQEWLNMYKNGLLPIEGLRKVAPLVADAVEREKKLGTERSEANA